VRGFFLRGYPFIFNKIQILARRFFACSRWKRAQLDTPSFL